MNSTRQQLRVRAERMNDMAAELFEALSEQIKQEGILQTPDICVVLATACVMSIVSGHEANPELGSEMAQTAIRVIIKNLMLHHVKIPDLEMEGWVPPNIQSGNNRQH